MATSKLLEHLENIKIFTDFKKSGLSNIDEFWGLIDSGLSIHNLGNKKIKFKPKDKHDPTEVEIKESELKKEWLKTNDLSDLYVSKVQETIVISLERDNAKLPLLFEISYLKKIISKNRHLKSYLSTSEDILNEYIVISENIEPELFFGHLKRNDNIVDQSMSPSPNGDNKINNPWYRIFTDQGWMFYSQINSDFCNSKDDYAYILRKLQSDGFIYKATLVKEFVDFVFIHHGIEIEKFKTLNLTSNINRDRLYTSLKELYIKKK